MEFTTFRRAFMAMPAQIISTGRRIVFRLLSWNPWQEVLQAKHRIVRFLPGGPTPAGGDPALQA
jgi:hypothetical protein